MRIHVFAAIALLASTGCSMVERADTAIGQLANEQDGPMNQVMSEATPHGRPSGFELLVIFLSQHEFFRFAAIDAAVNLQQLDVEILRAAGQVGVVCPHGESGRR